MTRHEAIQLLVILLVVGAFTLLAGWLADGNDDSRK